MKKVLLGVLVLLIIAGIGTGFYFRSNIIGFVNDKLGNGESIILDTYNMEDNASIKPFLDVQKSVLSKKDYKNFLNNINQQVTYDLKEIGKILPGYDTLSNVLFVEDENSKTIDFINMNNYDNRLEASYTAFVWVGTANKTNPNWNGFFQENEFLIDTIKDIVSQEEVNNTEPAEETEAVTEEITLSEFQSTNEYNEIIALLNEDVDLEDTITTSMKSTFGDNYDKVINLMNSAKKDITLNIESANFLGENEYGIGYGGKVIDDSFYLVTGKLKEDNTLGDEKYVLFRVDTSGNYDDYSKGIIMLASLLKDSGQLPEVTLPSKSADEEEETIEETTIEQTEEETVAPQVKESKAEESSATDETTTAGTKKSPTDLFEELMNSSEASTEEN